MAAAVAKPTKRAQVAKACQRCKRMQKGCSAFRPCQRCVRAGLGAQCVADSDPGAAGAADPAAAWSVTRLPTSPAHYVHTPLASFAGQAELLPAAVVAHCRRRFFAALYPTIPILSEAFVDGLCSRLCSSSSRSGGGGDGGDAEAGEAHCLLAALCAMVLLQVEPAEGSAVGAAAAAPAETNSAYGKRLFAEASAAYHHLSQRLVPSLERVLAAFFLYAGHAVQFHHSRAFFFLREASSLYLLLRPDQEAADAARRCLADRLFWVLLVSERSHAIRYQRPATLQITPASPGAAVCADLPGLARLVALFRPLDTSFVALLNQEQAPSLPPSPAALAAIESAIDGALLPVAGDGDEDDGGLCDTQRANLQTTQLWLQIILWQLRLRLGFLSAHADRPSLTYHYPLDVAARLAAAARRIPLSSLRVHGAGLTEKFFDVACTIVDVLARVPVGRPAGDDDNNGGGNGAAHRPEDDLQYLRRLVSQLPGGAALYDALLDKHILQTLPEAATGR